MSVSKGGAGLDKPGDDASPGRQFLAQTKSITTAPSCHPFVNASLTECRDAEHSLARKANSSRIVLRSRVRTLYTLEQASSRYQLLSTIYRISR